MVAVIKPIPNLQSVYIAMYGRPADPQGLSFWNSVTSGGTNLAPMIASFAASPEFKSLFGFSPNDPVPPSSNQLQIAINKVYQQAFGREADVDGLNYWTQQLQSGAVNATQFAIIIVQEAAAPDAAVVALKMETADLFTDSIDTTPELLAFPTDAGLAAGRAFLAPVVSVATQPTQAQIDAELASIVGGGATGQTFTLTIGADTGAAFTGTANNDTFNAAQTTAATWTTGDAIDGGAGVDTFNVTQTGKIVNPVGATVRNIEVVNLLSGETGNDINATLFTGLTTLNVTGVTTQTVSAATTADINVTGSTAIGITTVNGGKNVTVTETGAAGGSVDIGVTTAAAGTVTVDSTIRATGLTGSTITVKGGTAVSVTQKGVNAVNTTVTDGAVTITGDANTKTVTVTNDKAATAAATVVGHVNGAVSVTDVNASSATVAGVIETVTLNSFAAATVNSGALKTLNLSGTGTSVDAGTLGALTTAANTALALNVNGLTTTGAVTIDTDITTLNIGSSTAASTVASLVANGATTVNVSGDAAVTLTGQTLGAVTAINVSNTAGASFGTALGTGVAFTGGAGADSILLTNAFTKAITMGAGNDTVTYNGAAGTGGSVVAGDGTDTIVMTGAQAASASGSSAFNSTFSGFEALTVSAGGAATINLAGINNASTVNTAGQTGILLLNSFVSGGTINLTGATGGGAGDVQASITNADVSASDIVNLKLTNSTAGSVAFGTVTAANVETINISTVDTGTNANTAATVDSATLVATSATSVKVVGSNGLNLTNTGNVAITTFDASGVVGNGTNDTGANLAVTFTSANTTATATVTITGGAGNDVLTGNAAADVISGGAGNDTLSGLLGNDTISGGAGTDGITGGRGVDNLTGGAGVDTFSFAAGDSGATFGANFDTITDFVVGTDKLQFTGVADVVSAQQAAVQAAVSALAAGSTDSQIFSAMATANTTDNGVSFATFNGNSYALFETTGASNGVAADDVSIKLIGLTTAPTFPGDVIA
jgi:S-layer protein